MVSGKYGGNLVSALYNFSIASGQDPQFISSTTINPAINQKEKGRYSVQTLLLEYNRDVKLGISLVTTENSQYLSVLGLSPEEYNQRTIDDLTMGNEELPTLLKPSFLPVSGNQARETYEQIRTRTPHSISHLRTILQPYEELTLIDRYGGSSFSPSRIQSKIPSPEMRRRLGR